MAMRRSGEPFPRGSNDRRARSQAEQPVATRLAEGIERPLATGRCPGDERLERRRAPQRIELAVIRIKIQGDLIVAIGNTDTKVELTLEQTTTIKTQPTSYMTPAAPPPMPPMPPVPPKM